MTIVYSRRFLRSLEAAPPTVRKVFFTQLGYLERDLVHPSLRAKKYGEAGDLWQGRVSRDRRF